MGYSVNDEYYYNPVEGDLGTQDKCKMYGVSCCLGCCMGSMGWCCLPCCISKGKPYRKDYKGYNSFIVGCVIGFILFLLFLTTLLVIAFATDLVHAGCHITVTFTNNCDDVRDEVSWRINGQYDEWHDPHNNGTYSWVTNSSLEHWHFTRLTGDGKYTDDIYYDFYDIYNGDDVESLGTDGNGCQLVASSRSRALSVQDYGTNFCNIHDLYCSDEECHPNMILDYGDHEVVGDCSSNWSAENCYQC
mmetsp:Transcript_16656/g.25919  ORF Transcript_16656/g.25919 Transcript_16656/m.25919 type:complete len:246 (-) Transcript_16656:18-755(-)